MVSSDWRQFAKESRTSSLSRTMEIELVSIVLSGNAIPLCLPPR